MTVFFFLNVRFRVHMQQSGKDGNMTGTNRVSSTESYFSWVMFEL